MDLSFYLKMTQTSFPGLQHSERAGVLDGGRAGVRDGVRHPDGTAVPDRLRARVPDHHAAGKIGIGTAVYIRGVFDRIVD